MNSVSTIKKENTQKVGNKVMKTKQREWRGNKDIWKYLYDLDKELREKRDKDFINHKLDQESKKLKGCTFSPNIAKNCSNVKYERGNVYQRTMRWKKEMITKYNKNKHRINHRREEDEKQIQSNLLFKPQISNITKQKKSTTPIKGMNKFINRYRVANKERESKFTFFQQRDLSIFNPGKSCDEILPETSQSFIIKKSEEPQTTFRMPNEEDSDEDYGILKDKLHKCLHELY